MVGYSLSLRNIEVEGQVESVHCCVAEETCSGGNEPVVRTVCPVLLKGLAFVC